MAELKINVDDQVKKQAEMVCDEMGISLSTAINIYLKKIAREYRIPIEISIDRFYSRKNIEYLEDKLDNYKKGNEKIIEKDLIEE